MDLCSLEDAFPNIDTGSVHRELTGPTGFPFVGGTDSKASKEERRAARKKAKKLKGPSLAYSDSVKEDLPTDPDRLVKRMDSVGTVQDEKDGFTIPVLPKASCLFSDAGTPAYFGKDVDDDEGFSSFSAVGSDNPNFMLQPDFTKTFDLKGAAKAAGLPEPNLDDTWKPLSPAASYTAYVSDGTKEQPGWSMNVEHKDGKVTAKTDLNDSVPEIISDRKDDVKGDRAELLGHINTLMGRLEVLEKKKSQDSQTEILLFVGTGIFLLLSFDLLTRR